MEWNAKLYDNKHEFVSQYGRALLEEVNRKPEQKILDLGCGTGKLTGDLAELGAEVIGVDASPEMVETAKANYPGYTFQVADATALPFENEFDTVFSNAVFHWIPNQDALLHSVYRALKPNGVLVCEFGGYRNTEQVLSAFKEEFEAMGHTFENPFYYPSTEEYSKLLRKHGFEVVFVRDFDRSTPLNDGKDGLRNWYKQFYVGNLSKLSESEQNNLFEKLEARLCSTLWNGMNWTADYRRIQAKAKKPK